MYAKAYISSTPGTDIVRRINEKVIPTTKTDRAALSHDVDYYNVRSGLRSLKLSIPEAKRKIRDSDNRLISAARKNIISSNPVESAHALAVSSGIGLKEAAEKASILDELKFVGKGKKKDPLYRLRKAMLKPYSKKDRTEKKKNLFKS